MRLTWFKGKFKLRKFKLINPDPISMGCYEDRDINDSAGEN